MLKQLFDSAGGFQRAVGEPRRSPESKQLLELWRKLRKIPVQEFGESLIGFPGTVISAMCRASPSCAARVWSSERADSAPDRRGSLCESLGFAFSRQRKSCVGCCYSLTCFALCRNLPKCLSILWTESKKRSCEKEKTLSALFVLQRKHRIAPVCRSMVKDLFLELERELQLGQSSIVFRKVALLWNLFWLLILFLQYFFVRFPLIMAFKQKEEQESLRIKAEPPPSVVVNAPQVKSPIESLPLFYLI